MTTTMPTPLRVRSTVPSDRVMRLVNPIVAAILRSPFHRLLSRHVLLLTYTGRKTGKQFTIPVGYTREGDTLTVFSGHHVWWKNLRGGAPVAVYLEGRQRTAHAELIEDRAGLLAAVEWCVARFGLKGAGQRIGLALDTQPPLSRDDLAAALEGHAVVYLSLVARPDGGET